MVRYLALSNCPSPHLSSFFESYDCTNDHFCGHYVFTAHNLVLEVIKDIFVFLYISTSHCLHRANLRYVAPMHFPFPIYVLNHVYEMFTL